MIKSKVELFYEKVAADKELQGKIQPIVEKMKGSKNLRAIIENELIPVAKDYGFELTLKDFLNEETELKEHLSLDELANVSGGVSAKPLMFTALTLFGLLGVSAAAGQAHAADIPNQIETIDLSDSSDNENSEIDNGVEAELIENQNNNIYENPEFNDTHQKINNGTEPTENEDNNVSENCVATINEQEYESLEDAIIAAGNGDTIRVEQDITVNHEIKIDADITIVARGQKTIKRAANYTGNLFNFTGDTLNIGDDNVKNRLTIDGAKVIGCKPLIYFTGDKLNIKNTKLCNNFTIGRGAAIWFYSGELSVSGQTEICDNFAEAGSAIYCISVTNLDIKDNVKIHDNESKTAGGAILFNKGEFSISGQAEIYNNIAKYLGGAIFCNPKTKLNIKDNVKIHNNEAIARGGAIYFNNGEFSISGQAEIYNNFAEYSGGAIFCNSKTNLSIKDNVKIHDNETKTVGGAIFFNNGEFSISGQAEIYNNIAKYLGGAIFCNPKTKLNIKDNVKIHNNEAIARGGAIYFNNGEFSISGQAEIYNNIAYEYGSGIFNYEGNLNIANYNQIHDNGEKNVSINAINSNDTIDLICYKSDTQGNSHYTVPAQIRTVEENDEIIREYQNDNANFNEVEIDTEDDPFINLDLGENSHDAQVGPPCNVCLGAIEPGDRVFECFASEENRHIVHLPCLLQIKNHYTKKTIKCPTCENEYHLPNSGDLGLVSEDIYSVN